MLKRQNKKQTIIYKTLLRKLIIEQHENKTGVNKGAPESEQFLF